MSNDNAMPDHPHEAEPAIDWSLGLEYVGENEALYRRMLAKFIGTYANLPDQIEAAFSAGDRDTAQRGAHTLKGTCATLGMRSLSAAAAQLEASIRSGASSEQIEHEILMLRSSHNAVTSAIHNLLAG